jgi:hypothetical protein
MTRGLDGKQSSTLVYKKTKGQEWDRFLAEDCSGATAPALHEKTS